MGTEVSPVDDIWRTGGIHSGITDYGISPPDLKAEVNAGFWPWNDSYTPSNQYTGRFTEYIGIVY
jgi:hypothetical protein